MGFIENISISLPHSYIKPHILLTGDMIEEIKGIMMENSPLFAKFDSFNPDSTLVEEKGNLY